MAFSHSKWPLVEEVTKMQDQNLTSLFFSDNS
jgi:hypothetical protein